MLELLPGTRQQDITCTLAECSLDDSQLPSYDALSYVWGDATKLTPLQINGQTLMVTLNLRTALLNIRQLDQPCTLWVDAVCIDQANVLERNHQVSIMDEIYRRATRTIVWLGDSRPPFTKRAYAMVEELAAEGASTQGAAVEATDTSNYASLMLLSTGAGTERIESTLFDRFRDDISVLHLACASWWFRTWTVQEVLLASQAVVMTGTFTMNWARFCVGVDHGLAIGIWNPVMLGIVVDPIVTPYLSMSALCKQRRRFPSQPPPFSGPASAQALLELLIACRFRQASDPRDKVYALLGLKDKAGDQDRHASQASALGIEPDYSLSATEVYCHTARQLLLHSADLNMLGASNSAGNAAAVAAAASNAQRTPVPSWVPDWSNASAPGPHPLMHDALGRPRQTRASGRGSWNAPPRFSDDGLVLILSGHDLTTITRLSPVLHRVQRDSSNFEIIKRGDTLLTRLAALGQLFAHLARVYWELSSVVPHLATFWDWETFARESSSPHLGSCPPAVGEEGDDGCGYDPLAVYWQTLCAGTMAQGRGRYPTSQLFYSWRASLRAIFQLRRWRVDSLLRPLAFLGYLTRTWREYSEFACLLEHVYQRRLGHGSDGSLVLLPGDTDVGDTLVLVKGGSQPLVLRRDHDLDGAVGEGLYKFVGEAYVHGAMDGERFEEAKCVEIRIR